MAITVVSIPSLPEATISNDGDYLVISQSGVTKKIKKTNIVNVNENVTLTVIAGDSDSHAASSFALVAVNLAISVPGSSALKIKIGTTAGGSDIIDELEIAGDDTDGYRVALSYSCAGSKTIYVTEYSGESGGAVSVCLEIKKIYQ